MRIILLISVILLMGVGCANDNNPAKQMNDISRDTVGDLPLIITYNRATAQSKVFASEGVHFTLCKWTFDTEDGGRGEVTTNQANGHLLDKAYLYSNLEATCLDDKGRVYLGKYEVGNAYWAD